MIQPPSGSRITLVFAALLGCVLHIGCAQRATLAPGASSPGTTPAPPSLVELFPHVRADLHAGVVEFDGFISPILVKDPRSPFVYLEVIVCTPGTREHETLVVSRATPSHIHAALLAAGARPGAPGGFRRAGADLLPVNPSGDDVEVRIILENDQPSDSPDSPAPQAPAAAPIDPRSWIINARDNRPFSEHRSGSGARWVFAGSREIAPSPTGASRYAADLGGNIVGFSTFGDEVLALSTVLSPEAAVLEPEWVADLSRTPPPETPLRVRLRLRASQ